MRRRQKDKERETGRIIGMHRHRYRGAKTRERASERRFCGNDRPNMPAAEHGPRRSRRQRRKLQTGTAKSAKSLHTDQRRKRDVLGKDGHMRFVRA
eukprot:6198941-Pleurochrysis_carterae.AAC.2